MYFRHTSALACLAAILATSPAFANEPASDDEIAARLQADGTSFASESVVLWVESSVLPQDHAADFLALLDEGIAALTERLGAGLDTNHYSDKRIHVFVSPAVSVSHVYAGYAHANHDKPYLFLSPRRVARESAPYLHELTHILAWRHGSHSLREGLASMLELDLAVAGVGYSSGLFGMTDANAAERRAREILASEIAEAVLPWLGRTGNVDRSVTASENEASREAYYVLSQSFVRYLSKHLGLSAFLEIYAAADPEAALLEHSGKSRARWIDEWKAG